MKLKDMLPLAAIVLPVMITGSGRLPERNKPLDSATPPLIPPAISSPENPIPPSVNIIIKNTPGPAPTARPLRTEAVLPSPDWTVFHSIPLLQSPTLTSTLQITGETANVWRLQALVNTRQKPVGELNNDQLLLARITEKGPWFAAGHAGPENALDPLITVFAGWLPLPKNFKETEKLIRNTGGSLKLKWQLEISGKRAEMRAVKAVYIEPEKYNAQDQNGRRTFTPTHIAGADYGLFTPEELNDPNLVGAVTCLPLQPGQEGYQDPQPPIKTEIDRQLKTSDKILIDQEYKRLISLDAFWQVSDGEEDLFPQYRQAVNEAKRRNGLNMAQGGGLAVKFAVIPPDPDRLFYHRTRENQ